MKLYYHGGDCCGMGHIAHIYSWDKEGRDLMDTLIKKFDALSRPTAERGRILEVVLNSSQIRNYRGIQKGLEERDFELARRFINSNTGNVCYIYHRYNAGNHLIDLRRSRKLKKK